MKSCAQCHKPMNPVEVLMNPVCGACCRKNHQRVVKGR